MHKHLLTAKKYSQVCLQTISERLRTNLPFFKEKLKLYASLSRFDKPIGTFLLLWPTLWALWIAAEGLPSFHLLFVFVFGVFLTRSAGCVLNDYADREFDPHVERTRSRPMATGKVKKKEALGLAAFFIGIAFILVLTTNRLTVLLSIVAIPLMSVYPYMKRHTYVPQFFLGLAFSWGIIMAFAATNNTVPKIAWLVFIANLLWVMAYDTIYAMVDKEDDLRIGVKSMAILFDDADRVFIGIIQALMLIVFIIIGKELGLDLYYYSSLALATVLIGYHQFLIKDRLTTKCFKAFLHNTWLGAVIFLGIVLNYSL